MQSMIKFDNLYQDITYIMYCKIVLDVMNIDESTEAYYEHSLSKVPNTRLPYESNMLSKNKTES
jgi:hypothetical protein